MRQVSAAVYLSFGMLFIFLQGFEGFTGPDNMNFIIFLFFMAGGFYLYHDLKDRIMDKINKK
ncbi:hypothetical protein FGG79_14900 [Bacillus sp. BHET2]|uniref:hypothetical protein n=1 Tax=Bacillus sp. BHET2 TaxID=2583818 RepID=UPI00110E96FC|nr:hypothetical protein [Bacillus sp. BHET2]TMU85166.1 hypothetical protein FGG79_14900 [Bacillus sp. BHET2]